MIDIAEFQKKFVDFIYRDEHRELLETVVKSDVCSASRALNIYKNGYWIRLRDCLRNTYSTVYKLLNDHEEFKRISNDFIYAHPSVDGDLNIYGFEFVEFLRKAESIEEYLIDIAILDLASYKAYAAADYDQIPLDALSSIPPEQYEYINFIIAPAAQMCVLKYPVLELWRENCILEDEDAPKVEAIPTLKESEQYVMFCRDTHTYTYVSNILEHTFIEMSRQGKAFYDIYVALEDLSPGFDLQSILQSLVAKKAIVDYKIMPTTD